MWDQILGNKVEYSPELFNLGDLKSFMNAHMKYETRPYVIHGSADGNGYLLALMTNDKEKIVFFERKWRIEKITKFRKLIEKWGAEAKVIAFLDKSVCHITGDNLWRLSQYGSTYKGFGNGELESVSLLIHRSENGLYDISLLATEDWASTKYNVFLRKGISYKSVFNHINYFSKKLKAGVY